MKRKVCIQCLCLQIIYVNYPSWVGFYRGCGSSSMFTENLYSQKMRTCSGPRSCPAVRLPNSLESVPPQRRGERIHSIGAGSCGQHFHGYRLLLFLCAFIIASPLFFRNRPGATPNFLKQVCQTCTNPALLFCTGCTRGFGPSPAPINRKKPPGGGGFL